MIDLSIFESVDWAAAVARLHPVVLHLPVGLLVALACVELWRLVRRRREPDGSRAVLVFLLAVTAPMAAVSGWLLHETESYGAGVEWHEYLGIALMVLCLGTGLAFWRGSRGYAWLLALSVGLLLPTAHLGGSLTHGDDFLTEPWTEALEGADADPQASGPLADSLATDCWIEVAPVSHDFDAVAPFFDSYCTRCHGERKQKGGLALHDMASLLAGGEDGPVVLAGDPAGSPLVRHLRLPLEDDDHMPPAEKAQPTAQEIEAVAAWIGTLGAPGAEAVVTGDADGRAAALAVPTAAPSIAEPQVAESTSAASTDEPATPSIEPNAIERSASIRNLRELLVHVEGLGRDSDDLAVDFTAATIEPGQIAELLDSIASSVVELNLSATPLAPADLEYLARIPRLERLDLRRSPDPSTDIGPLANCPALTLLNLSGTGLAPGAVDSVASIASLETAYLWGCGLDESELQRLAALRPAVRIVGSVDGPDAPREVEPDVVFVRADVAAEAPPAIASTTSLAPINDICPVSGTPVDPRFTIAHEGRVVGFCCSNCPKTFWDDPSRFEVLPAGN
ncbi:c-type cytochrome domain-containing protein [Engelhardtia mirabilis]|uniref:Planctomycete cytochrome C n=1 Tax=Engelhardtia mirabilis TaxID=2528011 RepID=A0A518BMD4_9BACT|nr:Planctomycete cytochrome C [Planctomycetes bacterium Pla133]QDV02465.1 Planctomycete cytochrome C [Planctomycetes bacterium Pla86]